MERTLPEFKRPPVSEVVLSLQFDPIETLRSVQMGLLWQRFRGKFPKVEEQPPIDSIFEIFGARKPQPQPAMMVFNQPPVPRSWFSSADDTQLLQVQQDRLIRNWRRTDQHPDYPRYDWLRREFFEDLQAFKEALAAEGLGAIRPNQCEVTYVNTIQGMDCCTASDVLRIFAEGQPAIESVGKTDGIDFGMRTLLVNDGRAPIGRLHIQAKTIIRQADQTTGLRLTLTARGAPSDSSDESIGWFFDVGHSAIVTAFASITTDTMHKEWERIR